VVWETARDLVYKNQIKDVEELRQRVEEEWDGLDQQIDAAVRNSREWCKRLLPAKLAADERHPEHVFLALGQRTFAELQLINISGRNDEVIRCKNCIF